MVAAEPYYGHSADPERHSSSGKLPTISLSLKKCRLDFAQRMAVTQLRLKDFRNQSSGRWACLAASVWIGQLLERRSFCEPFCGR